MPFGIFSSNLSEGTLILFLLWMVLATTLFPVLYYRSVYLQVLFKLESLATVMERGVDSSVELLVRKVSKRSKKSKKEIRSAVRDFLEFFTLEPVSLDPFGIIRKIEHIANLSRERFRTFVKKLAPQLPEEEKADVMMGISAAISLNQIAKLLRHYAEFIKKTKTVELAMAIKMLLPIIERTGKALIQGVEALTNGWPIGDGIGPLVAARLVGAKPRKVREIEEDVLSIEKRFDGRKVYILKAKGPGARLGKLGRAVEKLVKREGKVAKIITIDAAAKLEGEKTGSIAEGVGVAIGGIGVDKAIIEEITTERRIDLDSIVIKMSAEEAIMPMKEEILNSVEKVCKRVLLNVEATRGEGAIIIVGVGNTCGIGNDEPSSREAEKLVKSVWRKLKAREKRRKKSFFRWIIGG